MEAHKEKSDDSANHHGGLDMSFVETCTEMLVSAIRNGSTYKEYCAALDAVFKIPGLKEQVDEIRRLNYWVQNASEETKLYEEMDDLDEKMDALSGIPEVNRFLDAELALCRQLQDIGTAIHQGIHLDVPDLS